MAKPTAEEIKNRMKSPDHLHQSSNAKNMKDIRRHSDFQIKPMSNSVPPSPSGKSMSSTGSRRGRLFKQSSRDINNDGTVIESQWDAESSQFSAFDRNSQSVLSVDDRS